MRLTTGLGLGPSVVVGSLNLPRPTHVFLVAGQSNATDLGPWDEGPDWPEAAFQLQRWSPLDPVDQQPAANLVAAGQARIVAPSRPLQHHFRTRPEHFGWSLQFAIDYLADRPGVDLLLVPAARGGTGFVDDRWNPGDDLYVDAVSRANRAMALAANSVFGGILWHQGEAETGSATSADAHASRLDALIAGLRRDIAAAGPTTPFLLGGMVPEWVAKDALRQQVQAQIEATPDRVAHAAYVETSATAPDQVGGVHFDAASLRLLGARYAQALGAAAVNVAAAPGQVTDLRLTPGDGQIALSWSQPPMNRSAITDYLVEVTSDGGETWSVLSEGDGPDAGRVHAGLINGTRYGYRVTAVNAAGPGQVSGIESETPTASAPEAAEADARGHWFFGADNATDADMLTGQVLTANGAAPQRGSSFLTISGQGNGLLSSVSDNAAITMVFVVRKPGNVNAILGGTLNRGASPTPSGASPYFASASLSVNNHGGAGNVSLDSNAPANAWLFIAVSLDATGTRVYFEGGAVNRVNTGTTSRGPVSPRAVALGDVHFDSTAFTGAVDFAEMVVWHSAKTLSEIEAIYERSKTRLAARGIDLA
ncbi:sialate O-acetylesterase [uncultured Limimaricola sp.]|uniref:sialate O-acetylesterase n=1 Tax=uncultured Limimaricola sp. TaxID=2211667 RepID=UPI0030F7DEFD